MERIFFKISSVVGCTGIWCLAVRIGRRRQGWFVSQFLSSPTPSPPSVFLSFLSFFPTLSYSLFSLCTQDSERIWPLSSKGQASRPITTPGQCPEPLAFRDLWPLRGRGGRVCREMRGGTDVRQVCCWLRVWQWPVSFEMHCHGNKVVWLFWFEEKQNNDTFIVWKRLISWPNNCLNNSFPLKDYL